MSRFIRHAARTVYVNPWLAFEAHDMVHPNGRPGEYGVVVTPPSVAVAVVDGDDVLLARQARYALDREIVEVVKGGGHDGESPLDAARREAREELGIDAQRWDDLGELYEIPSIVREPVRAFLARDLAHGATAFEDVETVEAVRMPLRAALAAAASGEIGDAITIAVLFRAALRLGVL